MLYWIGESFFTIVVLFIAFENTITNHSTDRMISQHQYIQQPRFFGRYQRAIAIFVGTAFFQFPFFFMVGCMIYALVTLDLTLIAACFIMTALSYPVKRSSRYVAWVRKYIVPTSYFNKFDRIFDEKIQEGVKPMFCFHPHSVFAFTIIANMNTGNDPMTKMRALCSRFIFNIPITGLTFRLFGVKAVDPNNLKKLMKTGQPIGLLPGGFQQATITTPNQLRVYIQKRFGFIKYALKFGYTIYPTLSFNEHKQYSTFDHFKQLRLKINKLKFPSVIFISRWLAFLNPFFDMTTVVGRGLKPEQQYDPQNPSSQVILEIHQKYIKQVQRLYAKYKHLNGDVPLVLY